MALSQVENRYLDMLTEREFPTMSPMESAQAMGREQDAMPADAPMQLAQAGPSDQPGFGGVPPGQFFRGLADTGALLTKGAVQGFTGLPGDIESLIRGAWEFGKSGRDLESFVRGLEQDTVLPTTEDTKAFFDRVAPLGKDQMLSDVFRANPQDAEMSESIGEFVAPGGYIKAGKEAVRGVKAGAQALAPKAGEMLSDYMQRSGLQTNLMAFHGTPHRFDKFDSSKIGTGEGAQAYGHGLYFAESKDVADGYRISLAYNPDEMKIGGKQINEVYATIDRAAGRKPPTQAQSDYEKLEVLERLMMNEMPSDIEDFVAGLAPETKQWFNKTVKPSFQTYGNLFTVDIPDEMVSKMLDWDKPLREQSQEIQRFALQNANALKAKIKYQQSNPLNEGMVPESIYDLTGRELYSALQDTGKQTQELFKQRDALLAKYMTGDVSMSDAVRAMNPEDRAAFSRVADQIDGLKNAPREASNVLREAGIPGVRYLDQGSRDVGEGSRNIVVFPGGEDQVKIIKTEGTK